MPTLWSMVCRGDWMGMDGVKGTQEMGGILFARSDVDDCSNTNCPPLPVIALWNLRLWSRKESLLQNKSKSLHSLNMRVTFAHLLRHNSIHCHRRSRSSKKRVIFPV